METLQVIWKSKDVRWCYFVTPLGYIKYILEENVKHVVVKQDIKVQY